MVEIKVGTVLKGIKKGESAKGSWAMCHIQAEKGYDAIDVWASNPEDVGNDVMEIAEILQVKKTARKYEKDGVEKWVDVYSVQAKFKPQDYVGFARITDEQIPF